MADLTIETAVYCASNEYFETSVDGHKVRFEATPDGPYRYGWVCDCSGYMRLGDQKRTGGLCKHIDLVKEEGLRCGWNREMDPTHRAAPDGTCPTCGGPVKSIRVGV